MSANPILSALSSRRAASLIRIAQRRVIYAAPGIQIDTAKAMIERSKELVPLALTVGLDFDEHTLRMGYGSLEGVEVLRASGVELSHCPGLRSGILIVDACGWVFSPTALYLEAEPQSDETPNAVELTPEQVSALAIRLCPAAKKQAIERATTPEEARNIAEVQTELGLNPIQSGHFASVKAAIATAPPAKFDVVRQVRVFEPYLQYVELSLTGASMQRKRVRIPQSLENIGASKELEGKLKTTFDLIEKGSNLSSKALEDDLNKIRKNFTPSLGKDHGRVVLKSSKPHLAKRISELRTKLAAHQENVEKELQAKLDESKKQVVDHYLPLAEKNPPDAILGGLLNPGTDKAAIRAWIEEEITSVFPTAEELVQEMTLEERYKDVTYETLNRPDFLESVKSAFPRIDWDKAYNEFRAAGESQAKTK
jgi:hypothetical protein